MNINSLGTVHRCEKCGREIYLADGKAVSGIGSVHECRSAFEEHFSFLLREFSADTGLQIPVKVAWQLYELTLSELKQRLAEMRTAATQPPG